MQVELIRFRKQILTLKTLKWELSGLTCLRNWAHCYPSRVTIVLFRDMTTLVHAISQGAKWMASDRPGLGVTDIGRVHFSK